MIIWEFLRPDMPFDEIGILLFAHMMHKHVVVFFNEIWWTTRSDNNYSKADCYLIYQGKCKYCDTIPFTDDEWEARKEYLTAFGEHYFETLAELEKELNANLHSTNEGEQADQGNSNEHSTTTDDNCTVHGKTFAVVGTVEKTEEEELLNEVESSFNVKVDRKKRPKRNISVEPTCRSKRLQNQDDRLLDKMFSGAGFQHSTSSSPVSKPKPKPRTTRNSNKTAASVRASNSVSNAAKKKGKFDLKNFVLKKKKKKSKPKKCSSCEQVFDTYKQLATHVSKDHPEYKYKCRYCPKTFNSSSWKYQHQARHKGLQYQCGVEECSRLFQYAYQLRDHMKIHTGEQLYVCSTRKCGKGFTTKRARTYHEKKHSLTKADKLLCDYKDSDNKVCGKKFERIALLTQHKNGHFGKKYVTRCGKVYNWPNSKKYHQDRCDLCKEIKQKELLKFKKKK